MSRQSARKAAVLRCGALYFVLVFAAGFVLGTIRVTLLVPRLGMRTAELAEMPVMLVVMILAARHVVRRLPGPVPAPASLGIGFLALGLLLAAELGLTAIIQGQSLAEFIAGRDPVSGSAYLVMLGVFAILPFLLSRR
jgi:hypothetical protein